MTAVSGFQPLGLKGARLVSEVRAVLDPPGDMPPSDLRALDSNAATLRELDEAAHRLHWHPISRMRCEADAAFALGLDQPDNTRRLRAMVARAYAAANAFAFHLDRKHREGDVFRRWAAATVDLLQLTYTNQTSLDLLAILDEVDLRPEQLARMQRRVRGLGELATMAWSPADIARLWYAWRLAELFALSTGKMPGLYWSGRPEDHARSHWNLVLRSAFGLAGLGMDRLDKMLRELNGTIKLIGGGETVDIRDELEGFADWFGSDMAQTDLGRLAMGSLQTEGLTIDVHALMEKSQVPASETRPLGTNPPRNAAEAYADPFAF